MKLAHLLALPLALAALARPARAQEVAGRLVGEDGAPAAAARLQLVAADSEIVAGAVSGADGRFSLAAPAAGAYRIVATAAGGAGVFFGPVTVAASGRTPVVLHLPRSGTQGDVTLATLAAVARVQSPLLEQRGFYQRKSVHYGRFLTGAELSRLPGRTMLDHVRGLGIMVEPNGSDRFSLYRFKQGQRCYLAVFVDGQQAGNQILARLTDDEVAGVEYYRDADIPAEYNPYLSRGWECGVVVIWTTRGEDGR
ncbi:MAG: carboxypeptidase regulatory-like domain-containing protein [Gemmatimonadetes bacterium]|nr:carboxypeptidase regulatory-like domain-containing protein [Gemmatimonadota bacterium]